FIECCARSHTDVGESAVAVIVVENAGSAVAGDINVGPAVVVEVESGNAEGVMTVGSVDVGFRGDVLERAVAAIVVEDVLRAGKSAGAAHHGHAFPHAGRTLAGSGSGRKVEVNVVGDHEIEVAVAIVVYP